MKVCLRLGAQGSTHADGKGQERVRRKPGGRQTYVLLGSLRRPLVPSSLYRARAASHALSGDMSDDESDEDGPKNPTTTRKVECAYCEGARARIHSALAESPCCPPACSGAAICSPAL